MSFKPTFRTVSSSGIKSSFNSGGSTFNAGGEDRGSNFSAEFGTKGNTFKAGVEKNPSTKDHTTLINRDAQNQHPISAITFLTGELDVRPSMALSNMDIAEILAGD